MGIEELKAIIAQWAHDEPLVTKAYIFGSRVRNDFRDDSDLDVAVEIRTMPGDSNVLATWIGEHKSMEKRLAKLIPYKLQLENLDGENTPTVQNGVRESGIMVYSEE